MHSGGVSSIPFTSMDLGFHAPHVHTFQVYTLCL